MRSAFVLGNYWSSAVAPVYSISLNSFTILYEYRITKWDLTFSDSRQRNVWVRITRCECLIQEKKDFLKEMVELLLSDIRRKWTQKYNPYFFPSFSNIIYFPLYFLVSFHANIESCFTKYQTIGVFWWSNKLLPFSHWRSLEFNCLGSYNKFYRHPRPTRATR